MSPAPPAAARSLRAIFVAGVTLLAAPAGAGPIYTWVDAKGDVHITDRLADVPEPYHSLYEAEQKRRELEAARRAEAAGNRPLDPAPAARPPAPAARGQTVRRSSSGGGSYLRREATKEAKLRADVERWRARLQATTAQVAAIDTELARLRQNPMLAATPKVRQEIQSFVDQRAAALAQLAEAREMLLTTLPDRARREGIDRRIFREPTPEAPPPEAPPPPPPSRPDDADRPESDEAPEDT